jgi:hypothetical protein
MDTHSKHILIIAAFVAASCLSECFSQVFELSFERNDSTLISEIHLIGKNVSKKKKKVVLQSISLTPVFTYNAEWKESALVIKPKEILEELTKYQLHVGDGKTRKKQSFAFMTGPYPYAYHKTNAISPQFWFKEDNGIRVNSDGLLEVFYGEDGWHRNFTTVAQLALACYDDYIRNKNPKSEQLFWTQVKDLCSHYNEIDNMAAYPYSMPWKIFSLPAGWYSGLAQGQVLSVLVRAFVLSNDDYYLDVAQKVADFMFRPVQEGGVFTYTPEGYEWIEEYPTNPPSYVWNGHVFAIMGLIDFNKIRCSEKVSEHIDNLIMSVKNTIEIYDTGSQVHYWRWDSKNLCGTLYTGIETYQCLHLYHATKDMWFYDLYKKWLHYFDHNEWEAIYKVQ